MSQPTPPKLNKLPFLLADVAFLALGFFLVYKGSVPFNLVTLLAAVGCVALGFWAGALPFLRDHETLVKFAEADRLADTVKTLRQLETLSHRIESASASWQAAQEHSEKAIGVSRELADKLTTDAKNFAESMQRASDSEKGAMKLEIEKLRRGEGEWLKLMVGLLDHTYALYQAGQQSGQENVIRQLTQYQLACRDVVRRVGLVPFEAASGEPFNPDRHQTREGNESVPPGAVVTATLATGFTFQGRLLRPALVDVSNDGDQPASAASVPSQGAAIDPGFAANDDALPNPPAPGADDAPSAPRPAEDGELLSVSALHKKHGDSEGPAEELEGSRQGSLI